MSGILHHRAHHLRCSLTNLYFYSPPLSLPYRPVAVNSSSFFPATQARSGEPACAPPFSPSSVRPMGLPWADTQHRPPLATWTPTSRLSACPLGPRKSPGAAFCASTLPASLFLTAQMEWAFKSVSDVIAHFCSHHVRASFSSRSEWNPKYWTHVTHRALCKLPHCPSWHPLPSYL